MTKQFSIPEKTSQIQINNVCEHSTRPHRSGRTDWVQRYRRYPGILDFRMYGYRRVKSQYPSRINLLYMYVVGTNMGSSSSQTSVRVRMRSYQEVGHGVREKSFRVEHVGQHAGRGRGGDVLIVGVLVDLEKIIN